MEMGNDGIDAGNTNCVNYTNISGNEIHGGIEIQNSVVNIYGANQYHGIQADDAAMESEHADEKTFQNVLNKNLLEKYSMIECTPAEEKHPVMRKCSLRVREPRPHRDSGNTEVQPDRDDELEAETITFEYIFTKKIRFVAIIGGPGSGKSTFVVRFGKMVLDKKISNMKGILFVLYVKASELATDRKPVTLFDFLLKNPVHGFDTISQEFKKLLKQKEIQKKLLLIIDGLDDVREWKLDRVYPKIDYDTPAEPSAVMYNLLLNRLLPDVKILVSSRPYGIQNYHEFIHPNKTIKMFGFTNEDAKFLFEEKVGENGNEKWKQLSTAAKSLCTIPLMLFYVSYMQKSSPGKNLTNSSSILVHVLLNIYNQENWQKEISHFKKLKKFCVEKLKKDKIVFTEEDLEEFELKRSNIENLCVADPQKIPGVCVNPKHTTYIYFSHMLIQESLACLGFLDLSLDDFQNTLKDFLHKPEFHMVRQIACGILMNPTAPNFVSNLFDMSCKEQKQELFAKSLENQLNQSMEPETMLYYLAAIGEMGDGMSDHLHQFPQLIDLNRVLLTWHSVYTISMVLPVCSYLSELSFYGCNLDEDQMEILWKGVRKSELKIQFFNLGRNTNLGCNGFKYTTMIVCHCEVKQLDMHLCQIQPIHIKTMLGEFQKNKTTRKLSSLILNRNDAIGEEGIKYVGEIVEVTQLEKLDISTCNITEKHMKKLMEHSLESLKSLVLGHNSGLCESGLKVVKECFVKYRIEELHLNWSNLNLFKLEAFERTSEGIVMM